MCFLNSDFQWLPYTVVYRAHNLPVFEQPNYYFQAFRAHTSRLVKALRQSAYFPSVTESVIFTLIRQSVLS